MITSQTSFRWISTLMLVFLSVALAAVAQDEAWRPYDFNLDGVINHEDLFMLHRYWQASGTPLPPPESYWASDGMNVYRLLGNIGIGTEAPGVKLDVRGIARVRDLGTGSVLIYSDEDGGIVESGNASGVPVSKIWVNDTGVGLVTLYSPEGLRQTSLFSDSEGGILGIENSAGKTAVRVWANETTGEGLITLNDGQGRRRASFYSDAVGGILDIENYESEAAARVWVTDEGAGLITLNNLQGSPRAVFSVHSVGSGDLRLDGSNGNTNISLGATAQNSNHGIVSVHDSQGRTRAQMVVDQSGVGRFEVVSAKGTSEVGMMTDAKGRGILWANQTLSIEDHPAEQGSKIITSGLEGLEPALYHRGMVQLNEGRATLELPEDFLALADTRSMTIQLTPESLSSQGVAFERVGKNQIMIGELHGGAGSYPVHYVVQARRAGTEQFKAILSEQEFAQKFKGEPAGVSLEKPVKVRQPLASPRSVMDGDGGK